MEPKQKFYQHSILWDTFLNFLEKNTDESKTKQLLQLFMEQIVSFGKTINSEEFKHIKNAIRFALLENVAERYIKFFAKSKK